MTSQPSNDPFEKLKLFLDYVDDHFVATAAAEGVSASCTATCLLLFAAADALGGVYAANPRLNSKRFKSIIKQLGQFSDRGKDLWELRNKLVHEANASVVYLTQDSEASRTVDGRMVIDTRQLTRDFANLLSQLKLEVKHESSKSRDAGNRLKWRGAEIREVTATTPPPPVTIWLAGIK